MDDLIEIYERQASLLERQITIVYRNYLNKNGGIRIALSEIANFESGYSYSGSELQPSNCGMVTIKAFDRAGGFKQDGIKQIKPSNKSVRNKTVEIGDILVAHTDLTQAKEIVGNSVFINELFGFDSLIMSMDLVRVRSKYPSQISQSLIYATLLDSFKTWALGHCSGTTVIHLSKKALETYMAELPKDERAKKNLGKILDELIQDQRNLLLKIQSLKTSKVTLMHRYFD